MSQLPETSQDVLEIGKTVYFTQTEQYWDKPYTMKRHHFYDTKMVVLRGRVTGIKGNEFKAILEDNNEFERDYQEFVFSKSTLLANQDFVDFKELGKWKTYNLQTLTYE